MTNIIRLIELERDRLFRENEKMRSALHHCEGYFDNRADVKDGSYGVPEPNTEMSLLSEIQEAMHGMTPIGQTPADMVEGGNGGFPNVKPWPPEAMAEIERLREQVRHLEHNLANIIRTG